MSRLKSLERPLRRIGAATPTESGGLAQPASGQVEIVLPVAGDSGTSRPLDGDSIPVAIVKRFDDADVEATLTQIADPADDVRILTATSPGTGGLTITGHSIAFGYSTVGDIRSRILCDDGVIIKEDFPSTAHYPTPTKPPPT